MASELSQKAVIALLLVAIVLSILGTYVIISSIEAPRALLVNPKATGQVGVSILPPEPAPQAPTGESSG